MITRRELEQGATFRATWINSGATASPILYHVLSGSESLVNSYAGVDSGNGHYYVNARIDTPGLYKAEWVAVVGANTYRNAEWLSVYPYETDQPGRYITWDDVVNRYPDFSDHGGAVKAASHYISLAEARVEGRLGAKFTTPFSSNNMTVRDLAIDMTYLVASRLGDDEREDLQERIDDSIERILKGETVMVTTDGKSAGGPSVSAAWSNVEDYHPVFGLSDPMDWVVDSQQLIDEASDRGQTI